MKKFVKKLGATLLCLSVALPSLTINANSDIQEDLIASDFYEAVNGDWVDSAEIPADEVMVGAFMDIQDEIDELLQNDIKSMAEGKIETTNEEQVEMLKFYQLVSDFEARDKEGYQALIPYIEQIETIASIKDFNELVFDWADKGLPGPVTIMVAPDLNNAEKNALFAAPAPMILPDKSLYENPIQRSMLIQVYTDTMIETLSLLDYSKEEAQAILKDAIALDTQISKYGMSAEEMANIEVLNNPVKYDEFINQSENIDMEALIRNFIPTAEIDQVTVISPDYYENLDQLFNDQNVESVKAWMLTNLVFNNRQYFTEEMRQVSSAFEMALSGTTEVESPEEHGYTLTNGLFGEVIGDYYAKTYFGQEAKAEVEAIVKDLLGIYEVKLENNDWMSDSTKDQAIEKLQAIELMIGYPETYDEMYQLVKIDPELSLFENYININELIVAEVFEMYEEPVDRGQWPAPAHMVNAFYNPQSNAIIFPAGFLSAPFYDVDQTYSENLGGIGVVIAHEITHAFDNNGAKFDKLGNMNDWWTEEDYATFEDKSQDFIELWDGIPYADGQVNGQLTVGENIADLGGLSTALDLLAEHSEPNYEEFFINYGRIWRSKIRPEFESLLLTLDTHSPNKLRVNMPLQHVEEFYTTFDIQEDDEMYTPEEERVSLW